MKVVSNEWSTMDKKQRLPYVTAAKNDKLRYENAQSKMKNKRTKLDEFEEGKNSFENKEFMQENTNFAEKYDMNQIGSKDKFSNKKKEQNSSFSKMKNQQKFQEFVDPKGNSPINDAIKFNLPESRPVNYYQASPNPIPPRKDLNTFNNMQNYNYQDTNPSANESMLQNSYLSRNQMFSPMNFTQNRSPGVSPNMMPKYSPMIRNIDNFREYSNRNPSLLQRNPIAMGQSGPTPVNKNDLPYNDYYPSMASPSAYTPIRNNMQNFTPMFSPSQHVESSGIFGPSPSMPNGMSFQPFNVGKTPVHQYGNNNQPFMTPRPMNPSMGQTQDSNKKTNGDDNDIFQMNPFGTS